MKGEVREQCLYKDIYYGDSYFSLTQLCSVSHQLHEIYKFKPKTVLEIGIGNGFTSSCLRRSGIDVYTVDINPNLEPDLVSSIDELPGKLPERQFDLVVCCEVLEHMPFDNFEKSIGVFSGYSAKLFITLPSYQTWLGFSGFVRLPKASPILLSLGLLINRKRDLEESIHFWELGSHGFSTRREVKKILSRYYENVRHDSFHLNRYHEYFACTRG